MRIATFYRVFRLLLHFVWFVRFENATAREYMQLQVVIKLLNHRTMLLALQCSEHPVTGLLLVGTHNLLPYVCGANWAQNINGKQANRKNILWILIKLLPWDAQQCWNLCTKCGLWWNILNEKYIRFKNEMSKNVRKTKIKRTINNSYNWSTIILFIYVNKFFCYEQIHRYIWNDKFVDESHSNNGEVDSQYRLRNDN